MQDSITVGIEEELQSVSRETRRLSAHLYDASESLVGKLGSHMSRELHRCTIEIKTGIEPDAFKAVAAIADMRRAAALRAASQGQRIVAAGTHPISGWIDAAIHDDAQRFPHYAHLVEHYGDAARGILTFGMHVHLGLSDASLRMAVMNCMREHLPMVMALSANAPFFAGRDTGLESWRHAQLGHLPRMGIPDVWDDEASYFAHIDTLRKAGILSAEQGLWEDMRIHQRYGTLEIRICDMHHSLRRLWLTVAIVHLEALTLVNELRTGRAAPPLHRLLIEENKWEARRFGMEARLVDWRTGERLAMQDLLQRWIGRVWHAAGVLGYRSQLERAIDEALREGTGARQQRRWFEQSGRLEAVVDHLADETLQDEALCPA